MQCLFTSTFCVMNISCNYKDTPGSNSFHDDADSMSAVFE